MSSLHRAAQAGETSPSSSRTGAFESCFAQGLDLSEFERTSPTTQTRAAAERLQVKAREREDTARNEREDYKLRELAKVRAQEVKEAMLLLRDPPKVEPLRLAAPNSTSESSTGHVSAGGAFSAIIHMHGSDESGGSKRIRKKPESKRGTPFTHGRRRRMTTSSITSGGEGTKARPFKRSKRSKH